ncbi:HAD-IIB family hydrolase [Aquimarina intermedia]|uniref:Cof subfamily protein (Haloacid dehalogenase superfamily)/HAD superfamily hydrolase (TIGR01484 family) n=1 Tax=Aquimarina intermedia TaxID=350814 RepID=A0A5S5CH27_9FLAO|nr:HAD-IIB family hydrolase [Aquimarina intermedia]TYP77323.1 Cof subfamily protein (haloacid dehalogenase superfamily)/HAD superfamily hydrolase (TIGR01484 family) [Aquimarina intermedia]
MIISDNKINYKIVSNFRNSVFIFDIDGTLIPKSGSRISQSLLNLLSKLSTHNKVIFASARPITGVWNLIPFKPKTHFDYISLNGAYAIIDHKEYVSKSIKKRQIQLLLSRFIKKNLWLYSKDKWFSFNLGSKEYKKKRKAVKMDAIPINLIKDSTKILKAILISNSKDDLECLENFGFNFCYSNTNYIEINSSSVNKALFLNRDTIKDKLIYSFGDAENDLSLFEVSNTSIAMKNAHPKLIAKSDYVTNHNYYKGIQEGLNYFYQKFQSTN